MAEKTAMSGAAALLVPRFVHGLNAIAERAGFSTELRVDKFYSNSDKQHLIGVWRGPKRAFLGLKFLPPNKRRRTGGVISWPEPPHMQPVINGDLEVSRKGVQLTLSFGLVPRLIRRRGEVEIIEYPSDGYEQWFIYHGTQEALIAAGVCEERCFPTPKRVCKNYCGELLEGIPEWKTRRYPDGSFVHWRETEASVKARQVKHAQFEKERQERHRMEEQTGESQSGGDPDDPVGLTIRRSDIATFEVGAYALYDGIPVKITREYGLYKVADDAGGFVDDGGRFNLELGYFVEEDGGEEGFVPAHKLRLCDGKISHLKLVTTHDPAPRREGGRAKPESTL